MKNKAPIPVKNYISVFLIYFVVIFIALFVRGCYVANNKYQNDYSISSHISEVKLNELPSFISAHDNFYLYIGDSGRNSKQLEKKLVMILKQRDIKNDTVYLNATNLNKNMIKSFLEKYNYYGSIQSYPMFLIVKDQRIVLEAKKKDNLGLKIGDIEQLLDSYGVDD